MRIKFIIGMVVLIFSLQGMALAGGIVIKMDGNIMTNAGGGPFPPDYTGPASLDFANIEFFNSADIPPSPSSTSGRIGTFDYFDLGAGVSQFQNAGVSGSIIIRSWDGDPRIKGSHYGKSQVFTATSGSTPASQYNVADIIAFQTEYLASEPLNAPTIGSISEANQREGDTQNVWLSLSVNFSYSQGSAPNKVVATGYDFKYWIGDTEPDDTDTDRMVDLTGTSWSLPTTDPKTGDSFGSGTYHFKVRAKNEYGPGLSWSAVKDWPTLAGGAGGPAASITYFLKKATDGTVGLNTVSIMHTVSFNIDGNPINNVENLVDAINSVAGAKVVEAVGTMKNAEMQGVYVTYDESGNATYTSTAQFAEGKETVLARGESWQISVSEDVEVTFSQ